MTLGEIQLVAGTSRLRIVAIPRVDRCLVPEVQACIGFTELYPISPAFFRSPSAPTKLQD
jgi:hypothetical protein